LFHRRRTVHHGHGPCRICRNQHRLPFFHNRFRYLHPGFAHCGQWRVCGRAHRHHPFAFEKNTCCAARTKQKEWCGIIPALRSLVSFKRVNFMDDHFGIQERQDVIFCRNVIIYFDKQTQATLMKKFHRQLHPGGYLFIGHSETLNGLDVPFKQVGNTVYRKE